MKLDEEVSKAVLNLEMEDLEGTLPDNKAKARFFSHRAKLIAKALEQQESSKLLLAGKWLFDSYCGSNQLLSFLQTMVSLEILLGDKAVSDLMGLGELLRNRYAYLIGQNHKERQDILSDFRKIYEVRS